MAWAATVDNSSGRADRKFKRILESSRASKDTSIGRIRQHQLQLVHSRIERGAIVLFKASGSTTE